MANKDVLKLLHYLIHIDKYQLDELLNNKFINLSIEEKYSEFIDLFINLNFFKRKILLFILFLWSLKWNQK